MLSAGLHWLRDTLYREDQSQVRTRSGPRAMAALRNLAIGALHLAGRHDTTEATRWASRNMHRPVTILGLPWLWPAGERAGSVSGTSIREQLLGQCLGQPLLVVAGGPAPGGDEQEVQLWAGEGKEQIGGGAGV